jgi:hypothetical protein
MPHTTAFFGGIHKLLGGRKPLAALDKLLRARGEGDVLCSTELKSFFPIIFAVSDIHSIGECGQHALLRFEDQELP